MKILKLSVAVVFLTSSFSLMNAQQSDSLKKEKSIEGVIIQGSSKKGNESNLLNTQKKSVEVIERVGSTQLAKQGIGDVAAAVTKATGTIKQEGSGQIFVRGLGDRYNATTLNGLPIPSDDPENKNIDLSIFKTSMVDYISLDKVYNPKLMGDFGGASINIVSKEYTGKPYIKVGVSSALNLQTFNQKEFKLQDGAPGFFGFKTTTFNKNNPGQAYPFTTKWNFKNADNPFNSGMNIEGGTNFDLGSGRLSLYGYAGFDNNYEYNEDGKIGFYNSVGEASKNLTVKRSLYETGTTALVSAVYKINANNKINFTSNYIHKSSQDVRLYHGFLREIGSDVLINRADNKITDTWINQLLGTHKLNSSWTFEWALNYNMLNSKRPDRMQNTIYAETHELIAGSAINNHRYFDELKDNTYQGYLHLTKEFNDNIKLSFGYDGSYKDRKFDDTTIGMNFSISPTVDPDDIDSFINSSNSDLFTYYTFQYGDSSNMYTPFFYNLKQFTQSGFANIDIKFSEKFVAQIGGRFDYINRKSEWFDAIYQDGKKDKSYSKPLGAVNLKYSLNDKQNLRFAVSKTYTLPQPKEIVPIGYYDIDNNTYGNEYVKPSDNYNADLKWEFFPKAGEVISVAAFGKYITDPIARTNYATASASDMTYMNIADWGYVYGAELEFRKDIFQWSNSKIYTFLNGTIMQTKQKLKSEEKIQAENGGKNIQFNGQMYDELQGAAKYSANVNLGYNHKWNEGKNDLDFVVSYAYVGRNLYALGTNNTGNFYQKDANLLDVVFNINLDNVGIGVHAKNLLNPHNTITQENSAGTFINRDYLHGREIGLSLSYKF